MAESSSSLFLRAAALALGLMVSSCASTPEAGHESERQRVGDSAKNGPSLWIVSIDGLRPEFYNQVAFHSPVLHELARKGASAREVEPIYPSITYPNHTTLVTGVYSDRHGIYSNRIFDPETGPSLDWYWQADKIRVKTLWDAAREAGLSSALLNWPVSVGAQADWVIPEVFPRDNFRMSAIWEETVKATKNETLQEILPTSEVAGFVDSNQHDAWMEHAAQVIARAHSPRLLLLHLTQLDLAQHEGGRENTKVHVALERVDTLLGKLLNGFRFDQDCVFITGDHGFSDVKNVVRVNALFAREGWIRFTHHRAAPDLSQGSAQGGLQDKVLQWDVIAHGSGAQAAVYARTQDLATKATAALKGLAPRHFRILSRKELDSLHAFPGAAFAIEPLEGFAISADLSGPLLQPLKKPHGEHGQLASNHGLRTGFIAAGACARAGKDLKTVPIVDIAPTAARFLGISLPDAQGKALDLNAP